MAKQSNFIQQKFGVDEKTFVKVLSNSPSAEGYLLGALGEQLFKEYAESLGYEVLRIKEKPEGGYDAKSAEARGDFYIRKKGSKKDEHSGVLYRLFEKWDILWEERRKRKNPQSAWTGARSAVGTQDSADRALRAIREAEAERHRKEERFLSFKEHLIGLAGIALAILAYVFLSHMIG